MVFIIISILKLKSYPLTDRFLAYSGLYLYLLFQIHVGIDLSFLSFIMFIAIIAAMVQLVEMIVEKFAPALYNQLGIFLPLIAVNCAIMGASLFMQQRNYASVLEATTFGLGSGIGWMLAIVCIAAIREKLKYSDIPAPLRGIGITFIVTGLMAISFMSFLGIDLSKLKGQSVQTEATAQVIPATKLTPATAIDVPVETDTPADTATTTEAE